MFRFRPTNVLSELRKHSVVTVMLTKKGHGDSHVVLRFLKVWSLETYLSEATTKG